MAWAVSLSTYPRSYFLEGWEVCYLALLLHVLSQDKEPTHQPRTNMRPCMCRARLHVDSARLRMKRHSCCGDVKRSGLRRPRPIVGCNPQIQMRELAPLWKLEQRASGELDMETSGLRNIGKRLPYEWTFLILKEAPLNGKAWQQAKTDRQTIRPVVLSRFHQARKRTTRRSGRPEERVHRMTYFERAPVECVLYTCSWPIEDSPSWLYTVYHLQSRHHAFSTCLWPPVRRRRCRYGKPVQPC